MIQKVLNIIDKNFTKIDILSGVRKIQNVSYENDIDCFAVYENKELVGVVTKKELACTHPNRIIADAMTDKYKCVNGSTLTWEVKEIFDCNKDVEIVFVEDNNDIKGFLTRTILDIELARHVDLLTGLYKNEYIFYNIHKLINSSNEMSLIFIDLNNFGRIDKKYGHINGDLILKGVANTLRENISEDTYLCRYAGDEFVVLTPYSINECGNLGERLINAIKLYEFPNNIPVSASIGIAGYKAHNSIIDDTSTIIKKLINIASLASTKAKKSINNLVVIRDMDTIA